ncbi:MAG: hypothetical protein H0V54_14785 [Chthoniobacterales bacterium]|nr:hypothetical protein [Chthoniobacterales bacterium]
MKRNLLLPLLAALALGAGACQKQQTDAERNAEIERQVQERVNAERQADDRQKMAERQAALEERINALAAAQKRPSATATAAPNEPASSPARASAPAAETGSYSIFYRKLDPYGDWMETSDYGYVFQPRQATQARDWRPYTNGHWVYTDAGWTWISDEKFGWATYHYGRWVRLRSVGWVWVPGEQWAPAWVSWRKGGGYVGWAPLPPEAQFDRQTGIRNWADNYYDIGPDQYAFVPANEFGRKLTSREILPTERNVTIINQTTNITNIVYNNSVIVDQGPSYDDLRKQSRQPIERYRLERTQGMTNDVPVFKGEVVALPTVDFRQAERATRPARVTRTIAQPVAERGWAGIENAQAAQKARAKMQSEATPPPNLPPKRFVRPNQGNAVPPPASPVEVARPGKPTLPTASITPLGTPVPAPITPPTVAPTASPRPTPTEASSSRPDRKNNRPQPTATAAVTPVEVADPTPPLPAENVFSPKEADRNRREAARAAQEAQRKQREEAQAQRQAERQEKMQGRRGQKPGRPEASPAATPKPPAATVTPPAAEAQTPTPAASASAETGEKKMTAEEKRRAKRAEKRAERQANKRASGQTEEAPEPVEGATPEAQQP